MLCFCRFVGGAFSQRRAANHFGNGFRCRGSSAAATHARAPSIIFSGSASRHASTKALRLSRSSSGHGLCQIAASTSKSFGWRTSFFDGAGGFKAARAINGASARSALSPSNIGGRLSVPNIINLRRAGLSYAQIGDIVGMSAKMVEHYCRNADMRSNSRAALTHLERAMAR